MWNLILYVKLKLPLLARPFTSIGWFGLWFCRKVGRLRSPPRSSWGRYGKILRIIFKACGGKRGCWWFGLLSIRRCLRWSFERAAESFRGVFGWWRGEIFFPTCLWSWFTTRCTGTRCRLFWFFRRLVFRQNRWFCVQVGGQARHWVPFQVCFKTCWTSGWFVFRTWLQFNWFAQWTSWPKPGTPCFRQ